MPPCAPASHPWRPECSCSSSTLSVGHQEIKHLFDDTPGGSRFLSVARGTKSHEGSIERLFDLRAVVRRVVRRQSMSVVTHKSQVTRTSEAEVPVAEPRTVRLVRRGAPGRPPTRRRVAGAPRVLARRPCDAPEPRLSLVWVLVVAAVAFVAVVGLGMLASSVAPSVPSTTKVVRVLPGESLWELAGRVAPDSDPSAVVERIEELNGVEGGVHAGQPLTVPYSK